MSGLKGLFESVEPAYADMLPGLIDMGLSPEMERLVAAYLLARQYAEETLGMREDRLTMTFAAMMLRDAMTHQDVLNILKGVDPEMVRSVEESKGLSSNLKGADRDYMRLLCSVTNYALELNERLRELKPADAAEA